MSAMTPILRAAVATGLVVATFTIGSTQAMATSEHTTTVGQGHAFGQLGPLTDLVVQRLLVGDQVAASKFDTDKPIDDPVREQQELADVRARAAALGIDPDRTAGFFQDQITASKIVQRGLFDRWTAHPAEAPTTRPDLNAIREELDRLTTALLGQLVATSAVRTPSTTCHVAAAEAAISASVLDHLDALHREALRSALRSAC